MTFFRKTGICLTVAASMMLVSCKNVTDRNAATANPQNMEMWYKQPAEKWMESLPIGNGRLGAMVYGGTSEETLALNESTLWSGEYDSEQHKPFGKERMEELRKLFFEGKVVEGNQIAGNELVGTPHSFGTHLPVGDLKLRFSGMDESIEEYKRVLDLNTAVSTVTFKAGDVTYTREYFASNPDSVLVVRLSADKEKSVSFDLSLDLLRQSDYRIEGNQLVFFGQALFPMHGKGGVHYEGRIAVANEGGTVLSGDSTLKVENADEAVLVVDFRTDFKNPEYKSVCKASVDNALAKVYTDLKAKHIEDYSRLFSRVDIQLGDIDRNNVPTDVRRLDAQNGVEDPSLDALFFQYGRYLTIASSRSNSPLPIALQGFFNDNKACTMPWTNDYHLDMNTQQNYWVANVGNLAECNVPLFNYIADLAHYGAETARVVYGCKGWTAHTTANVWGFTAPSYSILWGLFPTASSWIAAHLWTEYEYTQDKEYLRTTAYPLLKGNAEFLLDYMTEDPRNGHLVTGPSISPENGFGYNGQYCCAAMMPTCDRTFAYEILSACLQSTEILGIDKTFGDSLRTALAKFPPYQIGRDGGIMEWSEDFEVVNPNHRHTSHIMGFYPYAQITLGKNPELAAAVRKTMELRLAAPDWEDTEWSRANMICFYARLKDAAKAYESVKTLEGNLSRANLMTVSPGGIAGAENDIYAFDGNPGGSAGIAEMLLQTQEGYLELLPALPAEWSSGCFRGLCVRGGAEVAVSWSKSVVDTFTLTATADNEFAIKMPEGKDYTLTLNGKKIDSNEEIVKVKMKKGDVLSAC
ncbi:MAG: glycoside hydrolase family 95 protein [Bacteroides sp.]|nr:glycoside hydrolase family 95 protein [Roseburia sp.]MCM1347573.1 glycoside hydrolase family 95 protein [Bacteroides sp.]MCM1422040.1 glycoside hydrolase family 95 protein [Bacteroides sp.]